MLGNGLHMFDNGPHVLGKSTFGLMLHSGLLYTVQYVAFRILSHSEFCHIWNFVALGFMSHSVLCHIRYRIMSHSGLCHLGLCCIRGYVVRQMSYSDLCRSA